MTGAELTSVPAVGRGKVRRPNVIPTAYEAEGRQLEEIGCSLDYEGGPGMYASGPFGEASGRPTPSLSRPSTRSSSGRRPKASPIRSSREPGEPAQLGRQGRAGRVVSSAIRGSFVTRGQDAVVVCQAASILLQYPGETVRDRVPVVTTAVAAPRRADRGRRCPVSPAPRAHPRPRTRRALRARSTAGAGAAFT